MGQIDFGGPLPYFTITWAGKWLKLSGVPLAELTVRLEMAIVLSPASFDSNT